MSAAEPETTSVKAVSKMTPSSEASAARTRWPFRLLLFLVVALSNIALPVSTPFDSMFAIPTALSLIDEGNLDLKAYEDYASWHHSLQRKDGRVYSMYPIGPALSAMPAVLAIKLASPSLYDFLHHEPEAWAAVEIVVASLLVAVAAILFFSLLELRGVDVATAVLLTLVFAFASPMLSTATRALWQHAPLALCYCWALWLYARAEARPRVIILAALPLALAVVTRPLGLSFVVVFSLFVLLDHRRHFLLFFSFGSILALLWMGFNLHYYGVPITGIYLPHTFPVPGWVSWSDRIFGPLISPSRGIFVFSSIFLFALPSLFLREAWKDRLFVICSAAFGAHVLLLIATPVWWAGHSYGPRFMAEAVPFLTYMLLPFLRRIGSLNPTWRASCVLGWALAAVISFAIHLYGAVSVSPWDWNNVPVSVNSVDGYPRLTSWSDLQFARGTELGDGPLPWKVFKKYLNGDHFEQVAEVAFSPEKSLATLLGAGWSTVEPWGVWSVGERAILRLPPEALPGGRLQLRITATAYVVAEHPRQRVRVLAGGRPVADWIITLDNSWNVRAFDVEAQDRDGEGGLTLTFETPDSISPKALALGDDPRVVGLGLKSLKVRARSAD